MEREVIGPQQLGIGWLLFSREGRLNRKPYIFVTLFNLIFWLFICGFIIIPVLLVLITGFDVFDGGRLIGWVTHFLAALPARIKRCHDRGRSGWFVLLYFVPILCLWPMIELMFFRGTIGDNEYGKDRLPHP